MNIRQINADRRAQARHDALIDITLLRVPHTPRDIGPPVSMDDCRELWARMDKARDAALVKLGCKP
jgi:hypothetical protein